LIRRERGSISCTASSTTLLVCSSRRLPLA
jgi:hypothetical protein